MTVSRRRGGFGRITRKQEVGPARRAAAFNVQFADNPLGANETTWEGRRQLNGNSAVSEAHLAPPEENPEPTPQAVDHHAIRVPNDSGLLPCLYVPIAARNAGAILEIPAHGKVVVTFRARDGSVGRSLVEQRRDLFDLLGYRVGARANYSYNSIALRTIHRVRLV